MRGVVNLDSESIGRRLWWHLPAVYLYVLYARSVPPCIRVR